jgi:hypothetical protein
MIQSEILMIAKKQAIMMLAQNRQVRKKSIISVPDPYVELVPLRRIRTPRPFREQPLNGPAWPGFRQCGAID